MLLSQDNLQLLQEVPIFRSMEQDSTLMQLALSLDEVSFPANHTIIQQGERGPRLYILTSGSVTVHRGNFQIAKLAAGQYFGEMSLFDGQPHSASVISSEPCTCWALDREHLVQAIGENPAIGLHIMQVLIERIRRLNLYGATWLRGLLTVAWADGEYDPEEKQLIESLMQNQLYAGVAIDQLRPISGQELADGLVDNPALTENFLRMAVIMALANGTYSDSEDAVLREFAAALNHSSEILESLRAVLVAAQGSTTNLGAAGGFSPPHPDVLQPVRDWLDDVEIDSPATARFLCRLIPPQCPFERDIKLFGHKIVHIPPMCKLNPLYDQLVYLRFRALSYLADVCGEDVTPYV
ncbi:MAG: Mo-dependent nitrogenase C-terminal domain-containing protein [Leptolyngbyaceae cyanobacterium]